MSTSLYKIWLVCLLSLVYSYAGANGFSYIYIQGDKNIPFYIKFEDQMLPRYGKNYSIIPQLAPGPVNIQVLFQQNAYPAQKFTIVVPESGFRGFLLLQKGGAFSLYDIQQQFYLQPGNKAEDDHAPVSNAYVYKNNAPEPPPTKPVAVKTQQAKGNSNSVSPKFMPGIELNSGHAVQPQPRQQDVQEYTNYQQPATEEPANDTVVEEEEQEVENEPVMTASVATLPATANNRVLVNSDCPAPVSDREFEDIFDKAKAKPEKQRLKYLLTKMDGCYTTRQGQLLAETLTNDPERYTMLKKIYSRVTDQANFPPLENLLTTEEWKGYFKLILPK